MRYQFYLTIGDFSNDGHGICNDFLASAIKPVDAVRDAHLRIEAVTGIDLSGFADTRHDDVIPNHILERLHAMGYQFKKALYVDDGGNTHFQDADFMCDCPEELASIWAFLLNQADPELDCRLEPEREIPSLLVSSNSENSSRAFKCVGYGLF